MNTTLTIDKQTRDMASKRAKQDKLSVSSVARLLLKDYAEGRIQIGTRISGKIEEIEVDDEIQTKMDDVMAIWNKKKKGN